jgi:hypothetical protein
VPNGRRTGYGSRRTSGTDSRSRASSSRPTAAAPGPEWPGPGRSGRAGSCCCRRPCGRGDGGFG